MLFWANYLTSLQSGTTHEVLKGTKDSGNEQKMQNPAQPSRKPQSVVTNRTDLGEKVYYWVLTHLS